MTVSVTRFALTGLLLLALVPVSARQEAHHVRPKTTFRVNGNIDNPGEWSAHRISTDLAASIKSVSYILNGEPGKAKGIPLLSLVQYAKPRINAKVRNYQLGFVIIVKAADGYTATFSMGELLPTVGKRDVWVAFDFPDGPISDKEGPVQLIVPDDDKPSRWVHAIATISVVDGAQINMTKR